tara:strand:- start:480 stop:650 length:171 start_codon:yes stop_codon:yes gene_type:complete
MKKSEIYNHLIKAKEYLTEACSAASDEEIKALIQQEVDFLQKPLAIYLAKLKAKDE